MSSIKYTSYLLSNEGVIQRLGKGDPDGPRYNESVPDGTVPAEVFATLSPDPDIPVEIPKYSHCSHLSKVIRFDVLEETVVGIMDQLLERNVQFDTIAHRGISGAMVAPIIAYLMKKEQIIVRKNRGEGTASARWVEGHRHAKKYIVIDDLVASGKSFEETLFGVTAFTDNRAEFQKLVLYDSGVEIRGPEDTVSCNKIQDYWIKKVVTRWKNKEHQDYYF